MTGRWARVHVAAGLLAWAALDGVDPRLAIVRALLVWPARRPNGLGLGVGVGVASVLVGVADLAACPAGLRGVSLLATALLGSVWLPSNPVAHRVPWALTWLLHVAVVSRVGIASWAPYGVAAWLTLPAALSPVPHVGRLLGPRALGAVWAIAALVAACLVCVLPTRVPEAAIAADVGAWGEGLDLGGARLRDPARRILARVDDPTVSRLRGVAYDRWDGARWHPTVGPADVVAPTSPPLSGWQRPLGGVLLTPGAVGRWTLAPRTASASAAGWRADVPAAFPWQAVPGRALAGAAGPTPEALAAWRAEVREGRTYDAHAPTPDFDAFLAGDGSGDCTHFATLGVLRARASGWTARLVVGFAGGSLEEGTRVFRAEDAHAWVEVVVAGAWQAEDVTPPRVGASSGPSSDVSQPVSLVTERPASAAVEAEAADPPVPPDPRDPATLPESGAARPAAPVTGRTPGPWRWVAMGLALGALGMTWVAWMRAMRPIGWRSVVAALEARWPELVRPTPAATATAVRRAWGDAAAPVEAFVVALYEVRYGGQPDPGLRRLAAAARKAVVRRTR